MYGQNPEEEVKREARRAGKRLGEEWWFESEN